MYDHKTILSCLQGLIGFSASYSSDHPALDDDLRASASGVYANSSLHPLLTTENIITISEQFSQTNVRVYDSAVSYLAGEIVKQGVDIYQALIDNAVPPTGNPASWKKTNLYSAYLRRVYAGSCLKLLSHLFTDKKVNEAAKTLLASVSLFEGWGNIQNRITKDNRVVGFKIDIMNSDTAAILNYIGLQVSTAQNPINVYLYHSSSNVPVKTFAINQTKAIAFEWHKLATAQILSFLDDSINAGGHWYLCYYESELTGEAIRKEVSFFGNYTCGTCSESVVNRRAYDKWSRYVRIQPFYVTSSFVDNINHTLWEEQREIYIDQWNWGLNIQLAVQCDVTNWFCMNKSVLVNALSQQLTVDLLNEMAYSLRNNQQKEKIAGLAAVALDNQENGQTGEAKKLAQAIKALSFDFSGMNSVCLPCENRGVRLKSVWTPV